MRPFAAVLAAAALAGCAGVPFEKPARVDLGDVDAGSAAERFRAAVPGKFSLVATILFRYNRFRKMSAIGSIDVDTARREFAVACFSPLGVKLFEIASAGGETRERYVLPRLADLGDVSGAVGKDIERVYFDLAPPAGAEVKRRRREIVFRSADETGMTEHAFAGEGPDLVWKRRRDGGGAAEWKVSYYEYVDVPGGRLPRGVVVDNYRYGYRLVVKMKEAR